MSLMTYINFIVAENFLSLLVGLVLLYIFYSWHHRPKNFPPGPRGFPFLGVISFLGKFPERTYKKWSKTYGPIMSARLGSSDIVILNTADVIREAFVKQSSKFSGRPYMPFVDQVAHGNGIVFLDYGEKWKAQRKFGLTTLRGFGVGKQSMEDKISEEVSYLIEDVQQQNETAFNIQTLLLTAVSNVICNITLGERFDFKHPKFQALHRFLKLYENPRTNLFAGLFFLVPFLMKLPPFNKYNKKIVDITESTQKILDAIVEDHCKSFDESNLRDFIDAYLVEINKGTDKSFSKEQLTYFIRDLFFAGSETTSSTLYWSFLTLLHHPQIQTKLRKEIIDVIGSEGKVTMQKRSEMPFTCAFMEEIMRYRTLGPLSVVHATNEDAQIGKFMIPKGTTVSANIWAAHNDEKIWKNPEIFNPERFLDEKGNFDRFRNFTMTFSVGPRHCLGEQMARMEFFIFLVSLVRRFEFLPDPNSNELPDIEDGSNGFVFVAKPYKLVAKQI